MQNAPEPSGGAVSTTSELPAASPDEYNSFLSKVDLRSIRLAQCSVDARNRYDGSTLTPQVQEGTTTFEVIEGGFVVLHELMFSGTPEHGNTQPVNIKAAFELEYSSEFQITPNLFVVFRQHNLPVNVWPFFREFVHTVLARANWPVFVLPALQIPAAGARPRRVRASPDAQDISG
jgi:hypothetical protein